MRPNASKPAGQTAARDRLVFQGESPCASLIDEIDWPKTPIGGREAWPQSLRTSLSICLNSRFPILLWWGPELVMLYNDAYRQILGAKHPESMGMPGRECWPEIWDIIGPMLDGVLHEGQATWSENQLLVLNRNGFPEECYFTFSYSPIVDESGGVGGVFTAVTETTGHVVGDRRLRTLRDLAVEARDAMEAASRIFAVLREAPLDIPFALFYANDDNGCHLLERAGFDDVRGPSVGSNAPQDLVDLAAPRVLDNLEALIGEVPVRPWDEPPSEALAIPVPRAGADGRWGILLLGISPRLPFDRDYSSFFELVAGHLATEMADADALEAERRRAEALAEIDRSKTTFFTNISHEFRTPLTLLLGPLEELSTDGLPPADRDRIDVARRNARRLLRLVNTLLEFSRIEAGRAAARFEPLDLALLTSEAASMFESAFARVGVGLEIAAQPIGEPVYVDRDMWERIVLNLVSNAFKHTYEGRVRVALSRDGDDALLSVSDTGVGIAPAHLPRIFDRFHRIDSPRARSHEGTGIGLALVKELVHLHGGSIDAMSEPLVGSTFAIRIPLGTRHLPPGQVSAVQAPPLEPSLGRSMVDEAVQWLDEPQDAARRPGDEDAKTDADGQGTGTGPVRILVVDDNADMRRYIAGILEPDYSVTTALDGVDALERIAASPVDLVIADVMMPRLNGFEFIERVRADEQTRTLPVIFVSARAGDEAAAEGMSTGADDYLVKPFSARDLQARVAAHLSTARLREAAVADLRQTLEALRQQEQRLLAALDVKDEFLGMVSHELRSPLTTVLGNARLLLSRGDHLDPEVRRAILEDSVAEGERLNRFIDNLLVLARLEAGSRLSLEPVLLGRVIERVVAAHRRQHPERRIDVGACQDGGLVLGHEGSIEQVVVNLLSNAEKYSPPDEPIAVSCEQVGDEVVLAIADRGVGVDGSEAESIFRPFYRSARTTSKAGLGIGLAVCRRLVEAQGGKLWISTDVTTGATFCFTLPRADVHTAALP